MQRPTGVCCSALLVLCVTGVLAGGVQQRQTHAQIGQTEEERIPVSEHEHPKENIPTRPDYRGPGHWATPAPDSGIQLGFVPIKTYAQVRRSVSVKHLPRSDALASATTAEEKVNAPRLREVVTTKKITEVYTEEGYEDSAYDHGGYQKNREQKEGYVKPAATKHHDSEAQGSNAVPKQKLPPGTWERHKVVRNETRMMFLGDEVGKDTIPMKVVASYSHTIQHPGGNGDVIESGSVNMPSNRRSGNRRSSKVPRSSPHYTENLAIPLMPNDASMVANHPLLVGNRHSDVSQPMMVQNYPSVIIQHNSEESNHQLLLRNQQQADQSSFMQNPLVVQRHPSLVPNPESLTFNPQNQQFMFTGSPAHQTDTKLLHQLNQNVQMLLPQNNFQLPPNARPPNAENLQFMYVSNNPAESNVRLVPQTRDSSQVMFLPQARARPALNNKQSTRLTLVQDNPSTNYSPEEIEVSLGYSTPPVIIEPDTPSPPSQRFILPAPQKLHVHHRKIISNTRENFLTPPPQYQLTSRELVAYAKHNKHGLKSSDRPPNKVNASAKKVESNKGTYLANATKEDKEKKDVTTERTIITNGHLPWGVIANEGRKIPVSKLIPLKEFSDDDENLAANNNSAAGSITKIIKPTKAEDIPRTRLQKVPKTVEDKYKNRPQKTPKTIEVSDPRKNDSYSNELPHLAKFVEALTLAHYAPKNEHHRGTALRHSGRKHNANVGKIANRNKELQDMLAKVYASKQKSIQARGRYAPSETGPNDHWRPTHRYGDTSVQMQPTQVEHRMYPVHTARNAEHNYHNKMESINLPVSRAPRISRKVDDNFSTKDIKYPSGAREEARLEEEERLLEEEKDKEVEENVAQWKEAILEVDNPKPELDVKKYPFYNSPVTKSISPYSPLRYATNPKDIPRKTEGGMEFYESREKVKCPEVVGKLDVVPKRASSGEWNKKPRAKLPRLRGLGDKIDCLKTKYFGEEPLDNPFFKETTVGLPKSTSQRRVSEAEDEIEGDSLGLYADILKHVKSIGNPQNFPLYSSSSSKKVKPKQTKLKDVQQLASSKEAQDSTTSYSREAEKVTPKLSPQNSQDFHFNKSHANTHRKSKNKKSQDSNAPTNIEHKENHSVRANRPLHVAHKQHSHVPKVHPDHGKRVREEDDTQKREFSNVQFQGGFKPLFLNAPRPHSRNPEQHQRPHPNLRLRNNPIERPHGMHYGVSPHPYKIVSPAETTSSIDEVQASKDYNNIVGMQPPPVQKQRKAVHRTPKEYPTSIAELIPATPKVLVAPAQKTRLKRIKGAPEMSPPPLQYRLPSDSLINEAAVRAPLQQHIIDEMVASESVVHGTFRQPAHQLRSKRSAEFSEEIEQIVPLGVNDASPLLQRRQDHVTVDRLGNMYYGHVNGDDAYWTTAGNDVDPNEPHSYGYNDVNKNVNNVNSKSTEQPKPFSAENQQTNIKKPNYDSIITFNTAEKRQNYNTATATETKADSSKEAVYGSDGNLEVRDKKKGLPLTEAQGTPEVLSPEQINRILSGIMSRHSFSSRYRSEENPDTPTTTITTTSTSTTTEKPTTTSPVTTSKPSRKRPAKKQRVIPIFNSRVIPELITSTTKSPDIRKSRRRLSTARTESTITTTTERATQKGRDLQQQQIKSRRGKTPRRESSTASPNNTKTTSHRRKTYNSRENNTDRKAALANDRENRRKLKTATEANASLNATTSQRGSPGYSHPRSRTSHKTTRTTAANEEPDSTAVPPRVQAIETRRVTKEEIFTTRYYPEESEDTMDEDVAEPRISRSKQKDEDDREIYEPYATQHFHSGYHGNALQHDIWNRKSKIANKNSEIQNDEDVEAQHPHHPPVLSDEKEEDSTKTSSEDTEPDKDDVTLLPHSVFPQDREEFKDATVLTYVVDPNTGIGKWIPDTEDSEIRSSNRRSGEAHYDSNDDDWTPHSNDDLEETEESDSDTPGSTSEDSHERDATSSTDPEDSSPSSNSDSREGNNFYDSSDDSQEENDHESTKKGTAIKQHKVLQQIPKDKLMGNDEDQDNLTYKDDKTATDLYVLVSLLPSSEETTKEPVKYVKHPGERKYYYVQDYTDDDSENES